MVQYTQQKLQQVATEKISLSLKRILIIDFLAAFCGRHLANGKECSFSFLYPTKNANNKA